MKTIAAVVYNPTKIDLVRVRRIVRAEAASAGWGETLWFATTVEDPGQCATRQALDAGVTMVIAAGGDGTIRAVAEVLDGEAVPLALLPVGTGNQLARNLGLTLESLEHSIHAAFSGGDRVIDLARIEIQRDDSSVDRHAFLVMAGLGLDAKMFANTNQELKKRIGYGAYVHGFFLALRDRNRLGMRYRLDELPVHSARANTIIVGNVGSLKGNIMLLPNAVVDDGLLDVVLLQPESIVGWAQVLLKVFWENSVLKRTRAGRLFITKDVAALQYLSGRELVVRLSRPEEIQLDGDGFGKAVAFRVRIVPAGLTIRVPVALA